MRAQNVLVVGVAVVTLLSTDAMLETVLSVVAAAAVLLTLRPSHGEVPVDKLQESPIESDVPPISDEADVARRIYELRDQGESLPAIAAVLNAERNRTGRGAPYTPIQVWRILGARRLRTPGQASALLVRQHRAAGRVREGAA